MAVGSVRVIFRPVKWPIVGIQTKSGTSESIDTSLFVR